MGISTGGQRCSQNPDKLEENTMGSGGDSWGYLVQ